MMRLPSILKFCLVGFLATAALFTAGCGDTAESSSASADHPRKIRVGIRQDLFPTSYIDESGKPTGYDVEVAKKIDELLPQYEFEYEAVSQEALLTGLESGTYQIAVAGFYDSKERREKYLFPKEYIGGDLVGLTVRKSDASIKTLEDVFDQHKKINPIPTTSGMYGIVERYNQSHPEKKVNLVGTDWTDLSSNLKWVIDGRYDALVSAKGSVDKSVKKLGYGDQLVFNPFTAIKTYSLFNKKESQLADAYDTILKQLKTDGTASALSQKFFGEDVLPYIGKE